MTNETKALEQINEALVANDLKTGNFSDPNYTLGWISAIVKRELNK